ncbi:MAG TPA: pilin [Actinomycetota bacterium]|nr:pilin [Actinomycetota bacterium]
MPASLRPRRRRPPADRSRSPRPRTRRAGRVGRRGLPGLAGMGIGAVVLVVGLAAPAVAQAADPTLGQVIDRLRTVLVGLLVGLATLFLTVGGLRYLFAGGDPGQVEKAKVTLRSAAIGYGLAVLAPVLVRLLRYVVGS